MQPLVEWGVVAQSAQQRHRCVGVHIGERGERCVLATIDICGTNRHWQFAANACDDIIGDDNVGALPVEEHSLYEQVADHSVLLYQNKYVVLLAFDHTATDIESVFVVVGTYDPQCAFTQRRYDGCVVVHYLEQSPRAWQLDEFSLAFEDGRIRFCYLDFHVSVFNFQLSTFNLLRFCQDFLTFLDSFLDGADKQECLLGQVVDLAIEYHVEALDGVLDVDETAFETGECLGHEERL